jgi:aldehyde dehydrogenase (NAD+)
MRLAMTLVASLFPESPALRERFLDEAEAGILKLNRTTADAEVDVPFGGRKSSGLGPSEHGGSDREFSTRTQTVYR